MAVAAWYPDIGLSADFGYSAAGAALFKASNQIWSLAASGSETLFDGGSRQAAVEVARAKYDQAVAVDAARRAERIALNEYQAGTANYTTVVTAQATALSNQQTALQIQQSRMTTSVSLIKALGGGWSADRLLEAGR